MHRINEMKNVSWGEFRSIVECPNRNFSTLHLLCFLLSYSPRLQWYLFSIKLTYSSFHLLSLSPFLSNPLLPLSFSIWYASFGLPLIIFKLTIVSFFFLFFIYFTLLCFSFSFTSMLACVYANLHICILLEQMFFFFFCFFFWAFFKFFFAVTSYSLH